MTTRQAAARLCRDAADVIERRGWVSGRVCDDGGRVCVLGAVLAAAGVPVKLLHPFVIDSSVTCVEVDSAVQDVLDALIDKAGISRKFRSRESMVTNHNDNWLATSSDARKWLLDAADALNER